MTILAWDGKTLAADRMATNNGVASTVTKVFRLDEDRIIGISGHLTRGLEVVDWLATNGHKDAFPKGSEDEWYCALLIHRLPLNRIYVYKYEGRATPYRVLDTVHACGSGRDFALMAMHLGKTAKEAVELTCELSTECGNGVDTLSFD